MLLATTKTSAPGILIVDDDESNRETVRVVLEELPYSISEAATGDETLHALRAASTALIVVFDVLLPDVNEGLQVLRAICADDQLRRHALVAITASPRQLTPDVHELLTQLGAPLILKPFDIDSLLSAVSAAAIQLQTPDQPSATDAL